ncbi:MAG TPA: DUF3347 domain-containing protein [Cyclobacteriaceae bacterium]|jgi:predicted homoserine dehydrogenase-like protein|nr:DUF3347 domain-containing protein [Cyclobacteriaceae bacterium]
MKKLMTSIVFGFFAIVVLAQTAVTFKDAKVETAYKNYIQLKNALVASKADEAKAAAGKLKTSLASVKDGKNAMAEATKISNATGLDEIRKTFASLSNEMKTVVKAGQVSKGDLYLEYCPMANNNTGAYWLSNEKEIKNPYFGDKMLRCGSVKETIR